MRRPTYRLPPQTMQVVYSPATRITECVSSCASVLTTCLVAGAGNLERIARRKCGLQFSVQFHVEFLLRQLLIHFRLTDIFLHVSFHVVSSEIGRASCKESVGQYVEI